MSINYRALAREAVDRAKAEMASGDPERLPYAALELRKALEAATYHRLQSYKGEIPPDVYRTWQPHKVVQYLIEIDWMASYRSWEVSFRPKDERGKPTKEIRSIGTETVLTMKDLKRHYNAFGAFLHFPTLDQIENDKTPPLNSLKKHCAECVALLDKVLKSPISNFNFGIFAKTECFRCGVLVVKRLVMNSTETVEARCVNCGAEYTVSDEGTNKVKWNAKQQHEIECPTEGCASKITLWDDEIRPGIYWTCEGCSETYALQLRIIKKIRGESES
jgi:hypothetical protein